VNRAVRRSGLLAVLLLVLAGVFAPAAQATDPLTLTAEITDPGGVLTAQQTATVQASLDALATATPYQLYVVMVPSFGGEDPLTWVDATAADSGLGAQDFVLAFTTQAPYQYMLAPKASGDISSAEVSTVAASVEDALRAAKTSGDWSAAPVAAADGLRSAATGSGSGSGFGTVLLVGLAVIALITLVAVFAGRRRRVPAGALPDSAGATRVAGAADEYAALPTAELDRRSSAALVALDDALRGSEQELGFAQAQFGDDATAQFSQVLAAGKARITEAFRLRQTLDDDVPDTEPQVRSTAAAILRLCQQTADELDGQKAAFDQLRSVQERVSDALDAHARSLATQRARIEPARATLATLAARYPAQVLGSVSGNADQAGRLLDEVEQTLARGRAAVTAGDRATGVGFAKAAEGALSQVDRLLDAIDGAGDELASITPRLQAAIASITADLADVTALAPADPAVAPAAAEAGAAVTGARAALTGTDDPLAALSRIGAAEAALDAALAPMRERADHAARTRASIDQTLGRVASAVRATNDYIETRRGAVGPQARTRLAEADRLARQADARKQTDPDGALADAQRADQLVVEAQRLAQLDVERDEQNRRGPSGPGGQRSGTDQLSGMILGGILLGQVLGGGGHRGGGFGGGWGGGGGGFGGGGFGGGGGGGGFGGGGVGGGF
jgi:hypothetical protein